MKAAQKRIYSLKRGFTLVEILIAITILGTLIGGLVLTINPVKQISKANDSLRLQHLQQIKNALSAYYSDTNCYPTSNDDSPFMISLISGDKWEENGTVYFEKLPIDPITNEPYTYIADPSSCPQWGSVFGSLENEPENAISTCSLSNTPQCVPEGFSSKTACVIMGSTSCEILAGASMLEDGTFPTVPPPTPTTTSPTSGPLSSPTVEVTPTENLDPESFAVAMNDDPYFTTGSVSPYDISGGGNQALSVVARTGTQSPITKVEAVLKVGLAQPITHQLSLTSGSNTNGTWSGNWSVPQHTQFTFTITLVVTRADGTSQSTDLSLP